jgi:hypothetical protein
MPVHSKKLTYKDYLQGIDSLKIEEQVNLIGLLSSRLKTRVGKKRKRHSILELEGLGANIWKGIDAKKYVQKERESWG